MQITDGHTLCLLRSEKDRFDFLSELFRGARGSRECILFLMEDDDPRMFSRRVGETGLTVDGLIETGELRIERADTLLCGTDTFVPSRTLSALHDLYCSAIAEGYATVRFIIDLSWVVQRASDVEQLPVFESSLNVFCAERRCAVMTLYHLDQVDRGRLTKVLRAPRQVSLDGYILDNPYYTPAKDLFGDESDQILLNQMLGHIETKQNRDTLLDNEDLLRALFREIDVGFVLYRIDQQPDTKELFFQVVQANPVLEELNTAGPGELVGRSAQDLFPSEDEVVIDTFSDVAMEGQSARFERYQESSGRYFEIIAFRPKEYLLAALVTDVTERRRLEETRQKSEFRIRQTQKMEAIGRLASGVAHDFNNILTAIVGLTNVLMEEIPSHRTEWEDVAQIKKAADRAATLTRQLLAFSRKQKFSPQVVNLNRVIEDSSRMLSRIIGEDIVLEFKPGNTLKPVKVDPSQIEQILGNFAANARDAMPQGGCLVIETNNVITQEYKITGHAEILPGNYVVLTARDNGIGMTDEVMERIFEPFYTTKEKGKGTGLGLATVYGIVRQNEGNILVKSSPGNGTRFDVYFPLVDALPVETPDTQTATPPKGNATVMVAEDEDTVRNLTTRILERNGYRVVSAANAEEALLLWPKWRQDVDFLLTDVIMPGLNGLELFNRLHDDKPELRVLYMSGYPEDVIADQGMAARTVQLLEKPFSPTKLLIKIREILDCQAAG